MIELLVVVAIIALLVSILVPSLDEAKQLAQQAVCLTNLKNGGLAIIMYAGDFNEALPQMYPQRWFRLLSPYMSEAYDPYNTGSPWGSSGFGESYARCPGMSDDAYRTYGANYPNVFRSEAISIIYGPTRLVKVPPEVFLIADSYNKDWGYGYDYNAWGVIHNRMFASWAWDTDWDGDGKDDTCSLLLPGNGPYSSWGPVHLDSGNFVFVDGSARSLSIAEFVGDQVEMWGVGWGYDEYN